MRNVFPVTGVRLSIAVSGIRMSSEPAMIRGIDMRLHFETRVPRPTYFVMRLVEIDIQINPFTLR